MYFRVPFLHIFRIEQRPSKLHVVYLSERVVIFGVSDQREGKHIENDRCIIELSAQFFEKRLHLVGSEIHQYPFYYYQDRLLVCFDTLYPAVIEHRTFDIRITVGLFEELTPKLYRLR